MNVTVNNKKWGKVFLAILLFVYVFNPRFVKLDLRKVIDLFMVCYVFVALFKRTRIRINKKWLISLLPFGMFILYVVITQAAMMIIYPRYAGAIEGNIIEMLTIALRAVGSSSFVLLFLLNRGMVFEDFADVLIKIAFMQFICVCVAFVFPSIRTMFNNFTISNSASEYIAFSTKYNEYRCYGLAENLFDAFGYILTFPFIIVFERAIRKSEIKYFIMSFGILFMMFLNTRTGLILAVVAAVLIMIYYHKFNLKVVVFILLGVVAVVVIIGNFVGKDTLAWVSDGILAIYNLGVRHQSTGIFDILSKQMILPADVFFGAGASPESLGLGHTDIGYFQCIWRFGLFGTSILYFFIISAYLRTTKCLRDSTQKCVLLCIVVIIFIYLYKLFSFANVGANCIIISSLLCMWSDYEQRKFS